MTKPNPAIREVQDVLALEPTNSKKSIHRADWRVFVPTLIILLAYSAGLLVLWSKGMQDTALFRMFGLVTAIGVPLLAAHAFLRYATIRVQILPKTLRFHSGWPKDTPHEIPRKLITDISVRRGIFGIVFGGGTLAIQTSTGNHVEIADLANPQKILDEYRDTAKKGKKRP